MERNDCVEYLTPLHLDRIYATKVDMGCATQHPARAVKALPERRTQGKRGNALSVKEFRRFIATIHEMSGEELPEDIARLLLAVAWTGMRRGEALALQWDDVQDGELSITRSVWKGQVKSTKTDDPRRISMVAPLVEVFEEQRRWLLREQHPALHTGLVFPASLKQVRAGMARRGDDVERWFRAPSVLDYPLAKVVERAEVTKITVHSLRRTWENLLRQAGVDQMVRKAMAGWRTETAQAIYATVDREERDEAAEAIVRLVGV